MYCKNCGTELPDDANFCLKCGEPQNERVKSERIAWETCEIVFSVTEEGTLLRPGNSYYFWAKAIGPSGSYCAARSEVFVRGGMPSHTLDNDKKLEHASKLVDKIVAELAADGWEFVGTFGSWWQKRFRRKIVTS